VFNSLVLLINYSDGNVMKVRIDFHRLAPEKSFDPSMTVHPTYATPRTNHKSYPYITRTPNSVMPTFEYVGPPDPFLLDNQFQGWLNRPSNATPTQPSSPTHEQSARSARRRSSKYTFTMFVSCFERYGHPTSLLDRFPPHADKFHRSQQEDMSDAVPHYMHLIQENATSANLPYYVLPSKWTQKKTWTCGCRGLINSDIAVQVLPSQKRSDSELAVQQLCNSWRGPSYRHLPLHRRRALARQTRPWNDNTGAGGQICRHKPAVQKQDGA
jgi:hypothetical protein